MSIAESIEGEIYCNRIGRYPRKKYNSTQSGKYFGHGQRGGGAGGERRRRRRSSSSSKKVEEENEEYGDDDNPVS